MSGMMTINNSSIAGTFSCLIGLKIFFWHVLDKQESLMLPWLPLRELKSTEVTCFCDTCAKPSGTNHMVLVGHSDK